MSAFKSPRITTSDFSRSTDDILSCSEEIKVRKVRIWYSISAADECWLAFVSNQLNPWTFLTSININPQAKSQTFPQIATPPNPSLMPVWSWRTHTNSGRLISVSQIFPSNHVSDRVTMSTVLLSIPSRRKESVLCTRLRMFKWAIFSPRVFLMSSSVW